MRTFSLLKGMPVFTRNGESFGEVCDICIGKDGKVTDVLLQKKGLIGKKHRLPIGDILSFGPHVILVEGEHAPIPYKEGEFEHTMTHARPIAKKVTLSESGHQLGLLDDVYFLEEVGTIVGYELTDGFFSDITQGKRVIRTPHPPRIGKDAIIVSANNKRGGHAHDEVSELPK